jgi:hypothetical protein
MRTYVIAAALMLTACFSLSCSSGRSATQGPSLGNQNELTLEQIRASDARDALEAVERLRPLWLRTRSPSSVNAPNTILVYLNDTRLGGIAALRGYPLEGITGMTYLSASEAANKLSRVGTAVVDGAIVLSTRRQ